MTESRHVTVQIIRTKNLERNGANSIRRRNSKGKLDKPSIQDQKEKPLLNEDDHQKAKVTKRQNSFPTSYSNRININGRSIRVIHPNPSSTAESATWNTHSISVKSSHLTQSMKNGSINKNNDQIQNVKSASPIPLSSDDNNKIDTLNMIDRLQIEHPDDLLQKLKYAPSNLSLHRANSNNNFINSEIDNPRRRKKRRTGCFLNSPVCKLLCGILTVLLLLAIAALIVGLLSINKTTTTTTRTPISISSNTVTVTTDTTSTTTSLSTTTITITSTTTTTMPICSSSCLNQTWINNSSLFAKYKFENNYLDETEQYNATGINNPVFVGGYAGQAVSFAFNASQMVSSSYIPLGNRSYSVDAWIYPTALINRPHNSICGICTSPSTDLCFHTTVRYTNATYYLYHGFYGDDTNSNTESILINEWIHAAFTFDVVTRTQTVYHNGILLRSNTVNSPFLGMTGDFQIGYIPNLTNFNISNMFQGYIDELSVSGRVKSSCEILEQATLAIRFSFDGSQPLLDQGPNSVPSNGFNYTIVSGRSQNAISFTSSSPSYLQASGFLALGIPNQPFSISLWIQPASLAGTLVHQSNNSLGSDFCITYLGFASNGSLIAQILTNTGYVGISYSNLSLNTYSHVVQTWSSTNGLRLYVNNILIATQTATTSVASSAWVNYVTIGSCLNGCGTCNSGQISPGQFVGAVDDFRIYIRELTSNDVCAVYAYGFT